MIIQETFHTPITQKCDVLVCGGGFAGISAALAAARHGKNVILLEKQYILGGLGTAGLVTYYLPLCDGMGKQVSFGIAEELLRLSISKGYETNYPDNWLDSDDISMRTEHDKRFEVRYNPNIFALLVEQLLLKEGVKILYGSYAVGAMRESDRITAVIMENKSGRQAISADTYIDATGDCDIAYFAGAPTANYQKGNHLAAWYYFLNEGNYDLKMLGLTDTSSDAQEDEIYIKPNVPDNYLGLDGDEISRIVQLSHFSTLNDFIKRRKSEPGIVPTAIATMPLLRMTRRICGEYTLHDTEMHTYFSDSIGMVSNWWKRGPVYEVPFRTLYSKDIKNLITAGRCTSVTDDMWNIMRVIPCCAVTGQAAGTAAALTSDFSTLDISALQDALQKDGVILHENEL